MKKPVGRPKTLDREILIDIALREYWLYGINNVSLSKIAKLAEISRPGIYKEFGDEDGLKYEVLKKYTNVLTNEVIPIYYTSEDIKTMYYHIYSTLGLNVDRRYFSGISKSKNIKIPNKATGCLFEKTKIEIYKLNNKTKKLIVDFEKTRNKAFCNYIKRMQKTSQINSSIKLDEVCDYFSCQLSLTQILERNGKNKEDIKSLIDTALLAIVNPNHILH